MAAGHLTLVPKLKAELEKHQAQEILIVVGGVIPPQDYETLYKMGVAAVFGPGTVIPEAAVSLLEKLIERIDQS